MINALIEAISIKLDAEFGNETHMEEIKQDLKEPCFLISCLNSTTELFFGKRYFRTNQFCIQYFPESADKQRECNGVAERLMWSLEYITLNGDLVRGTAMRYELVDGVLQFFVNYNCFIDRVKDEIMIETISTNNNVKEGK